MAKNKTTETEASVKDYVAAIPDEKRREDCAAMIDLFAKETGFEPKMWGTAIVGFGSYSYKYDSGREGEAPLAGLSARAKEFTLYLSVFEGRDAMLAEMGKHKTGKGCIYVRKLEDIDREVLSRIISKAITHRAPGQSE